MILADNFPFGKPSDPLLPPNLREDFFFLPPSFRVGKGVTEAIETSGGLISLSRGTVAKSRANERSNWSSGKISFEKSCMTSVRRLSSSEEIVPRRTSKFSGG